MGQVADQACPILDSPSKATEIAPSTPVATRAKAQSNEDEPSSTADTISEHLVYARAERLLLDTDHGPVVWEHPRAAARFEVRVRRGAEDGARDARHGRQREAGEHQFHRESEESGVFAEGIAQVRSARLVKGTKEREHVPANHGWMAAMRMLAAVTIGSIERIRPSTPCFEAPYCGAFITPIHEAASIVRPDPGVYDVLTTSGKSELRTN